MISRNFVNATKVKWKSERVWVKISVKEPVAILAVDSLVTMLTNNSEGWICLPPQTGWRPPASWCCWGWPGTRSSQRWPASPRQAGPSRQTKNTDCVHKTCKLYFWRAKVKRLLCKLPPVYLCAWAWLTECLAASLRSAPPLPGGHVWAQTSSCLLLPHQSQRTCGSGSW